MKEIGIEELELDVFRTIGKDWMLLGAGKVGDCDAMTVSWGHMGCIWDDNSPTVVCYVRPNRYTKKFLDENAYFSLSTFGQGFRKELSYMGSHSGRDGDKIAACGLSVAETDGTIYFPDAELALICEKVYAATLKEECFMDKGIIERNYPQKDFHTMYVGKIRKVFVK
ncbi:MAG: flavin reductase [Clostridia bacterium]|nr:flavin reductase [Clostridia bacterium]